MPSSEPLPTVADLVTAATGSKTKPGALQVADIYGNFRSGGMYNHVSGPTAVLMSREAVRDRDAFRDIYFDDATGDALTRYVQGRYGIARILDTKGTGTLTLSRAAGGASNTILRGTRVMVSGTPPTLYEVSQDTTVGGTFGTLPIRALVYGPGVSIQQSNGLSFLDTIYDSTWLPTSIVCGDGTSYESAPAYRSRVRAILLNQRSGYLAQIKLALQAIGAAYVLPFASSYGLPANVYDDSDIFYDVSSVDNFVAPAGWTGPVPSQVIGTTVPHNLTVGQYVNVAGVAAKKANPNANLGYVNGTWPVTAIVSTTSFGITLPGSPVLTGTWNGSSSAFITTAGQADYGLNAVYVADANFQSPSSLVTAAAVALEGCRVMGSDLLVGGFAQTPLKTVALVTLVDDPGRLPTVAITRACAQALLGYFGPTSGGYSYKSQAMSAAMQASSPYVQSVRWTDITGGTYPNVGIYAGGALQASDPVLRSSQWPANIPRYTLSGRDIVLYLTGPV